MKDEKAAKEKTEQRLIMIAPLLDPGLDKEEFYLKRLEISCDFLITPILPFKTIVQRTQSNLLLSDAKIGCSAIRSRELIQARHGTRSFGQLIKTD